MDQHQKGWDSFIELCLATKDKKLCSQLFDLLLTPEEKTDLAMRVLIIKGLLEKEKTQRELAKDLNVSIAKITRGSNELKRLDPELLKYLLKKL